jgi:hypothetical protein
MDHHVSNISFGFYLAIFRRSSSISQVPSGSGSNNTTLASLSARSLPEISVYPGTQRTYVAPYDAARA